MDAAFPFQVAVSHVALDGNQAGLDARFIRLFVADHFKTVAVVLGITLVHAEQHLRPVLRLGTTGTRMDLQQGIGVVIVIGKQNFDLKVLKILIDLCVFFFQQFEKFRIVIPVELIEFRQNAFNALFTLRISILQILQLVGFLDDCLSLLLIRPEIFFALSLVQLIDLFLYIGEVKESRLSL